MRFIFARKREAQTRPGLFFTGRREPAAEINTYIVKGRGMPRARNPNRDKKCSENRGERAK